MEIEQGSGGESLTRDMQPTTETLAPPDSLPNTQNEQTQPHGGGAGCIGLTTLPDEALLSIRPAHVEKIDISNFTPSGERLEKNCLLISSSGSIGTVDLGRDNASNSILSNALNATNTCAIVGNKDSDEPVTCGECMLEFETLQEYMEHNCPQSQDVKTEKSDDSLLSDVETFDGKIVYNPDGSAYIIEGDSELSDEDSNLDLPQQEGSFVDKRGLNMSHVPAYPQIINAFHVSRNPAFYNSLYGQTYNLLTDKKKVTDAPIMHSYKVYNVRKKANENIEGKENDKSNLDSLNMGNETKNKPKIPIADYISVPTKPILMCFICKLSFGYAKSFVAHAMGEHNMHLNEQEREIMTRKNASAIIQGLGKDKDPLMSFLEPNSPEPVPINESSVHGQFFNPHIYVPNTSSITCSGNNTNLIYGTSNMTAPQGSVVNTVFSTSSNDAANINSQNQNSNSGNTPEPSIQGANFNSETNIHQQLSDKESSKLEGFDSNLDRHQNAQSDIKSENEFDKSFNESMDFDLDGDMGDSSVLDFKDDESGQGDSMAMQDDEIIDNSASDMGIFSSNSHLAIINTPICSQHPDGKTNGVECPKCDMVLGSSRSLGGHMTMMHSRNSCKTLKCPKCNWHYKYQETLEIHMKEKHPENETSCMYCITSQPHPRLARGETYTCGYKPFRCDVCNYSTTTKGNLSIHMQSDKHLNNIQELQNGGITTESLMQAQTVNDNSGLKKVKPKPTWRCDVCNYETNVARNLRIHMTSEKHTHNMMVLQQNVKHMQQLSALHSPTQESVMTFNASLPMVGEVSPSGDSPMGEMTYNPTLFMSMGPAESPVDLSMDSENSEGAVGPDTSLSETAKIYQCCVCNLHSTDTIEALHQHIQTDRTKQREQENLMVVSGNYICKLCNYKTNLKANFQLHCKTDKHLQRLQLVNHIREGGLRNEWRLKYLNVSNPVQVKCNACDYYTNSIHKLRLHSNNQRHETSAKLFLHLQTSEITLNSELKYYHCSICNYSTKAKLNLIQHVRSMKHLRNENFRQIQRKSQGKEVEEDICEIFSVKEYCDNDNVQFDTDTDSKDDEMELEGLADDGINDESKESSMLKQALLDSTKAGCSDTSVDQIHMCPYCNYTSISDMRIRAHVLSQHMQRPKELLCPLCQEECKDKSRLESHLVQVHNVTPEGLQRLLVMVDQGDFMLPPPTTPSPAATANDESNDGKSDFEGDFKLNDSSETGSTGLNDKDQGVEEYRCQTCAKTFNNIDALYAHQNELGHLEMKQTPRGPGYLCWKKGCNQYFKTAQSLQIHFREIHAKRQQLAVSERHVYKYRCNQCSLAFKTIEKLQLHSQYHLIRAATKCAICGRSFRSIAALQKHLETSHMDVSEEELTQYRLAIANNPLHLSGSGHLLDPKTSELLKKENKSDDLTDNQDELSVDAFMSQGEDNSEVLHGMGNEMELNENENCSVEGSQEQQLVDDYLNSQAIAEDSYNDPARKYKCHRCKVAFTKQSYLTSHNKTLLHRKGDKLSYPMEKYLDPNRPYKCEICKESFTQKNILLVHYNSVSHLHKLKRSITENKATTPPTDSDKKPYKCNICKVAYSQGSTLDIHMRSVLHQTRASKLQELAMTGQVDLNAPLVEQPEPTKAQQHKKILAEMLSTKQTSPSTCVINEQVPSPQPTNSQQPSPIQLQPQIQVLPPQSPVHQSPHTPVQQKPVSQSSPTPPIAQPAVFFPPQVPNQPMFTCQRCNSIFVSQDALHQHQQMYCYFQPMSLMTPQQAAVTSITTTAVTASTTSTTLPQPPPQLKNKFVSRNKLTIYKQLLESYGFDLVMQFNEYTQKVPAKPPPPLEMETGTLAVGVKNEKYEERYIKEEKPIIKHEEKRICEIKFEFEKKEKSSRLDLPEINKQTCKQCNKEFSSVWVLKAHSEEIHKNVVPLEAVEMFSDKFKEKYEKKYASQQQQNQQQPTSVTETIAPIETPPIPAAPPTPQQSQPPPTTATVTTATAPPPLQPMELQQLQFPPSIVNMGFGMGIPLNMNMSLAAMNMHPPLIPIMMPPHFDPIPQQPIPTMDPNFLANQQKLLQQQQQQQAQQQKRARTRINDEQLKILRAHFDINNSPSEDQILEMSEKSGLPHKVIKHWFRNALFKERQRNKDSPYNFSNPPSTTLNLDEYEKTGEAKAKPLELNDNESDEIKDDFKVEQKNKDVEQNICIGVNGNHIPTNVVAPIPPPSPKPTTSSPSILPSKSCSGITSFSTTSSLSSPASTTSSATSSCESATTSTIISAPQQPKQEPGRRANRTRFTDYQIKVLQEYFENNAYPKDDDLEHLSKLLNLSPRVIVVWFQNARQKARKVYENQPPLDPDDEGSGRFQRTPGLNYQCKKCLLVFQRYYELIKHRKTQCFKEEDRALTGPSGMDDSKSHSSLETESSQQEECVAVAAAATSTTDDQVKVGQEGNFRCEKCNLVFGRFDLWREHQNVHLMNPTLFPLYPATSPFGMLQFEAQQQPHPSPPKRKISEDFDDERDDQHRDKRLRTTILPEQLDYLYQKYQVESGPSRKMLESIARDVGLKKRVVQVWFQNTRARERKGQFRAHQQAIHKRCPFCRALFKAKSALESHLATKHADQFSKGEINIDNLPDGDSESSVGESPQSCTPDTMQKFMTFGMMPVGNPLMPTTMFPPTSEALQNTMKQYYEDSLKKYLDQLSAPSHHPRPESSNTSTPTDLRLKSKASAAAGKAEEGGEVTDAPLDLSKPVKINVEQERHLEGPLTDLSERSFDDQISSKHLSTDDTRSTHSESSDNMECDDYVYHDNSSTSPQNHPNNKAGSSKRYRTQMTGVRLKVMKTLFADYKTPTMAECEMLGREIGLPKRVVQVWFQNARAKEKKSKLAYAKHFGQEVDFSRPPEECKLCNFKYSHKYSIQDHIFTKKHVDNVRKFIEGQQEAERDYSDPMAVNKLIRPQETTPDPARKSWDSGEATAIAMAGHPHLAQLHALGLHSLGLPVPLPGMSPTSASISPSVSLSDSSKEKIKLKETIKIKKEKEEPKVDNKANKEGLIPVQNPLLTNPFDFSMLATDAGGFFPYMYAAGFSPYYGIASSFIHPAMYAGTPGLFYDPNMHGTPLGLLQVPQGALKEITQKLTEKGLSIARFTQDSKSMADLTELVNEIDMRCISEGDTEVGFVCKKCHMVYPAEILCHNHQRTVCYPGKNPDVKAILKLVQIHYECRACSERFTSQLEYKFHCDLESHIKKAQKFIKLEMTATGSPQEIGKKELSGNTSNTLISLETRDRSSSGTAKQSTEREGQLAQVDSAGPMDGSGGLHAVDDSGDSENFLEVKRAILEANAGQ